mmetsp:Transcript_89204/g.144509  ORF Transcript_89204/g.144509 Transcript_89204/m.144509 type:complete len:423 (+) Transcript_89204:3-1271(+)
MPFEGGILEFGTSNGPSTADWTEMPANVNMPKAAMRRAFENLGASYSIFWQLQGNEFKAIADYTTESRRKALQQVRGDDKSFASESRKVTVDASGSGPIATAAKTGVEVIVTDTGAMKRAALAKEFGIKSIHCVPVEGGVLEFGIPAGAYLSSATLEAVMKMRCDSSGAGYAIYWKETQGKLTVAGSYITPARKAALLAAGKTKSFSGESSSLILDATGNGPVATVATSRQPLFLLAAKECSTMSRKGLVEEYGIQSICLVPVTGGVLEYGTSSDSSTASWQTMEDARSAIMPMEELERAFVNGATHAIFWKVQGSGDGAEYKWGADYVIPERLRVLANSRGDNKSFSSESAKMSFPVAGASPVASAARSGKQIVIKDPATYKDVDGVGFPRKALAQEFNVGNLHFVPCKDGVLEYGTGATK